MPSAQVTQSAQVTEIPSAQVTARPWREGKNIHKVGKVASRVSDGLCLEIRSLVVAKP